MIINSRGMIVCRKSVFTVRAKSSGRFFVGIITEIVKVRCNSAVSFLLSARFLKLVMQLGRVARLPPLFDCDRGPVYALRNRMPIGKRANRKLLFATQLVDLAERNCRRGRASAPASKSLRKARQRRRVAVKPSEHILPA